MSNTSQESRINPCTRKTQSGDICLNLTKNTNRDCGRHKEDNTDAFESLLSNIPSNDDLIAEHWNDVIAQAVSKEEQ